MREFWSNIASPLPQAARQLQRGDITNEDNHCVTICVYTGIGSVQQICEQPFITGSHSFWARALVVFNSASSSRLDKVSICTKKTPSNTFVLVRTWYGGTVQAQSGISEIHELVYTLERKESNGIWFIWQVYTPLGD